MSSHVINNAVLSASNTTYTTLLQSVFAAYPGSGAVAAMVQDVPSGGGTSVEFVLDDFIGSWRKWVGARITQPSRAYRLQVTIQTYEQQIKIARKDLQYDKIGQIADRLKRFLESQVAYKDQGLHANCLFLNSGTGPICYDGLTLGSASHTGGLAGATWSNYGTTALSQSVFNTVYAAQASFVRENGEPRGIVPTDLVVGPKLRQLGMEITAADIRGAGYSSATLEGGTTVTAAGITNINKGVVNLVVDSRLVGTQDDWWYLVGRGPGGQKPVLYVDGMPPTAQTDDSMETSPSVRETDEVTYGLIADGAWAGGDPACIMINVVA